MTFLFLVYITFFLFDFTRGINRGMTLRIRNELLIGSQYFNCKKCERTKNYRNAMSNWPINYINTLANKITCANCNVFVIIPAGNSCLHYADV